MPDRYVGELRVLRQLNKYEFAFEADILRDGPVQGGRWEFARLGENYKTFAGKNLVLFGVRPQFNAQQRHEFLDRWVKEIRFK